MILLTSNKPKQILLFTFIGHVTAAELAKGQQDLPSLLAELSPGFTLLTDLSSLDRLDKDGVPHIAQAMEAFDQKGIGLVVRVIPDPAKDIGLKILSVFHYPHRPRIVTCESMVQAA